MQTEIRYAYSKAAELWQLVLSLSSYAGMHPVNCDDSTAEYLTRGSTELWQRLINLRQDFEPLDDLRQLSFREPCEFGSRDYWLEATLRTIGHQTHHWCRQVVVCRDSPCEFNAVCPVTTELETAVQRRLLSEQAQLLRDCKTYLTSQPEQAAPVPDTQLPSKPEPSEPVGSGTYIKLLSAYTNGASDTKLKAMAMVIDGKGTIDEKTEKLNSLLSLSTLSGETIGNLLGCTKQAIFKTRYWVDNRKDDIAKRSESRRNRLSRNGKQYEPGADDE